MNRAYRIEVILLALLLMTALTLPARSRAEEGTQRVLVEFVPGQKSLVRQSLQAEGAQVHYEFDELNVIAVTVPSGAVNGLLKNPNVVRVVEDARRYLVEQTVPYGVVNVEARQVWDADADGVVDAGAPTGANRLVCIIDSGVDLDHEDFAGVDFVGGYPDDWGTDTCGHGTHVAGTIAAMNNSMGVVGVSPGAVSLYVVKLYADNCAWTNVSSVYQAANRCRSMGANIINISLGGNTPDEYEEALFQSLYENDGILTIASAGNDGTLTSAYFYPASYDSVVSVAAVDQNDVVASFSRKNDKVELAAPGVNVYSTYKDGGYAILSGTSMAAPHVTAAAAVVWSSDPTRTNGEIRSVLQQTALDLGTAGRDAAYGYGVVRSLEAVQELNPPAPTGVDLVRFEAVPRGRAIRLEWETARELDNLGFNLYRARSADGPETQLNESVIASEVPGSPEGATYEFVDDAIDLDMTYYYWLEAVDVFGATTLHGPVEAMVAPRRKLLPVRPRPVPLQIGCAVE
jgi:hypothetical protein